MELLVILDTRELLDHLVLLELQGLMALLEHLVLVQVQPDLPDLLVQVELQAQLARKDQWDIPDTQVKMVPPGLKDSMELLDPQEDLEQLVHFSE